MSARFTNKVVLITGATSGMGRATAGRIAAEGAKVVLAARGKEAGDALAAELRAGGADAVFVPTDVTAEAEVADLVQQVVDRHGRLDGAFNNVGAATAVGPLTDIDGTAWNADLALNLSSVFFSLKYQLPVLQASGGGAIVNNASNLAITGAPGMASYSAAKHGVVGLTRSAALDVAASGVRINALVTGGVDTPCSATTWACRRKRPSAWPERCTRSGGSPSRTRSRRSWPFSSATKRRSSPEPHSPSTVA